MRLQPVNLKVNITACNDAREMLASELRRIANEVEDPDAFGESGNMGIADYGAWSINDPFENLR